MRGAQTARERWLVVLCGGRPGYGPALVVSPLTRNDLMNPEGTPWWLLARQQQL